MGRNPIQQKTRHACHVAAPATHLFSARPSRLRQPRHHCLASEQDGGFTHQDPLRAARVHRQNDRRPLPELPERDSLLYAAISHRPGNPPLRAHRVVAVIDRQVQLGAPHLANTGPRYPDPSRLRHRRRNHPTARCHLRPRPGNLNTGVPLTCVLTLLLATINRVFVTGTTRSHASPMSFRAI